MQMFSPVLLLTCAVGAVASSENPDYPLVKWYRSETVPIDSTGLLRNTATACIDFDEDGDIDCFVGTDNNTVFYYENVGNPTTYSFVHDSSFDIETSQINTKPFVADLNNDGYYDLYVGGDDGRVALYLNNGDGSFTLTDEDVFRDAIKGYTSDARGGGLMKQSSKTKLVTMLALPILVSSATTLTLGSSSSGNKFGCGSTTTVLSALLSSVNPVSGGVLNDLSYASPYCGDLDNDGDLDCMVGYHSGIVILFMNVGSKSTPIYDLVLKRVFKVKNKKKKRKFPSPFLYDFDGDGDMDLLVGFYNGKVKYYENTVSFSNETNVTHNYKQTDFVKRGRLMGDSGKRASPWCGLFNNMTDPECLIGTKSGEVVLWTSTQTKIKQKSRKDNTAFILIVTFSCIGGVCLICGFIALMSYQSKNWMYINDSLNFNQPQTQNITTTVNIQFGNTDPNPPIAAAVALAEAPVIIATPLNDNK